MSELSAMQQAEKVIEELEAEHSVFSLDEKNLIVNYAYKLDDMDRTRELAEHLYYEETFGNQNVAPIFINAQAEIDDLPDSMIGLSEMHEYGYAWQEMLPLTQKKAVELFEQGVSVHMLYSDGTESLAEEKSQITEHDGIFGVEKSDWQKEKELRTMQAELEEDREYLESQLLYGSKDKYGIYQLKDEPELRSFQFEGTASLLRMGVLSDDYAEIEPDNYNLVYTGDLSDLQGQSQSEKLNAAFEKFNIDRPEDFRGHSLSVSDIVVFHQDGENSSHYVDSFGFTELPEFTRLLEQEKTLVAEKETVTAEHIDEPADVEQPNDMDAEIIDLGEDREQVLADMKRFLQEETEDSLDMEADIEAEMETEIETELAFQLADRYITIQEVTDGYDYTIFDMDFKELDGGVYDNPDISIREALAEIVEDLKHGNSQSKLQGNIQEEDELIPMDYEEITEKAEDVNRIEPQRKVSAIVEKFKEKTQESFHNIDDLSVDDITANAWAYVKAKTDWIDADIQIVDIAISGSRCRGLEGESSDLDIVVEYEGDMREDDLFALLHEDGISFGGVKVDINPITASKTGTLETYLPTVETYLEQKRQEQLQAQSEQEIAVPEREITLYVAECGEFHNLGAFYEGITSVDHAIEIYNQIPPERLNGVRAIGVNVHTPGEEDYQDTEWDIMTGGSFSIDMLDYIPEIKDCPQAMDKIAELIAKMPERTVEGTLAPEVEAKMWEYREQHVESVTEQLAKDIDQFSYEYDTYGYHDATTDREEAVHEIKQNLAMGDAEYLKDWLQQIVSEGEPKDDVKAAKELLDRMAELEKLKEYKPLAKVEELEESNYNMIDNVLNNGAGSEKEKREEATKQLSGQEKPQAMKRTSLKERLEEKKALVSGKDTKAPEKTAEKNAERVL